MAWGSWPTERLGCGLSGPPLRIQAPPPGSFAPGLMRNITPVRSVADDSAGDPAPVPVLSDPAPDPVASDAVPEDLLPDAPVLDEPLDVDRFATALPCDLIFATAASP